ncbi:uncharacterized protein LOC101857219 [Aplysia californica]|uniref:Uncharacterized protein LOC101857219 n=1 Tax=Aplysia californica TaxID=6500 RepID=A0ABM0K947_APLCA|nr:uncharacterized protein LOC101857219 [Aplysia californica]
MLCSNLQARDNDSDADDTDVRLLRVVPPREHTQSTCSGASTYHGPVSEDSGYQSPVKVSVSSGESGHVLSSSPDSFGLRGDGHDITEREIELEIRGRKISAAEVSCDIMNDDVFPEEVEVVNISETVLSVDNHSSKEIISLSDKAKINIANNLHRAISDTSISELVSPHPNNIRHFQATKRRRSEGDVSYSAQQNIWQEEREAKNVVKRMPTRLKPKENNDRVTKTKKRRKAVVKAPTLAMENSLYHVLDRPQRQLPPAVRMSRKVAKPSASAKRYGDMLPLWYGGISRKRSFSDPPRDYVNTINNTTITGSSEWQPKSKTSLEVEASNLKLCSKRKSSTTHIVVAEVHEVRPSIENRAILTTSHPGMVNSVQKSFSLVVPTDEPGAKLGNLQRSPKMKKTFVKSPSVPVDRENKSKIERRNVKKVSASSHQYADFQNILQHSGQLSSSLGKSKEDTRPKYPHTQKGKDEVEHSGLIFLHRQTFRKSLKRSFSEEYLSSNSGENFVATGLQVKAQSSRKVIKSDELHALPGQAKKTGHKQQTVHWSKGSTVALRLTDGEQLEGTSVLTDDEEFLLESPPYFRNRRLSDPSPLPSSYLPRQDSASTISTCSPSRPLLSPGGRMDDGGPDSRSVRAGLLKTTSCFWWPSPHRRRRHGVADVGGPDNSNSSAGGDDGNRSSNSSIISSTRSKGGDDADKIKSSCQHSDNNNFSMDNSNCSNNNNCNDDNNYNDNGCSDMNTCSENNSTSDNNSSGNFFGSLPGGSSGTSQFLVALASEKHPCALHLVAPTERGAAVQKCP